MNIQKAYEWLRLYETNKANVEDLSRELNLSKRQVYRIIKRYKQSGIILAISVAFLFWRST